MLKRQRYEHIRTGYRIYEISKSELARQTGHSRNTIQKMLENEHLGYKNRSNQTLPVPEPYMRLIDSWLYGDKEQQSKQRHTARRIYHRLIKEHGFQGSEPTVRRYVRQAKAKLGIGGQKAFIPGLPDAGPEAEMDWGEFTAIIAGESKRLKLFCLPLEVFREMLYSGLLHL